ncbi:MAG: hypothetical protein JXC32_15770 [Anaerolineae bacterium]|nr:hypothetical protein [Anaerolineae bacterium]
MNKTRLLVMIVGFVLVAILLVVTLGQCEGQPAPGTETPGGVASPIPSENATTVPTSVPSDTLTPTPTEGEMAAAAVGQEYIAYRPTQTECEQIVDSGDAEACVWLDSALLITRPEWETLLPDTDFYLLELGGYRPDSFDVYDSRRRLVAWQDGQYYSADTFDQLLEVNGITAITDENRETVARAFALMIIYGYLEEEVNFTEWEEVEVEPGAFAYCLEAWTKIGGLELQWCFVFGDGRLSVAWGPDILQYYVGDYIDVPPDELPPLPPPTRYVFRGG